MKLLRQLWYILSPSDRAEGAFLLCALALGALFEAVSIGLVAPFIVVLKEPERLLEAPVARPVLSLLNLREPQEVLIAVGLGLVGVFVIKSGYLLFLYGWLSRYVCEKHVRLARQLLTGYLKAPYTFHLQRNSAELIKVMTETLQRFTTGFLVALLSVLGEVLVVVALTALLIVIAPLATLAAILVLGVPIALVYRSIGRRLASAGRLAEHSAAPMIQWTEQAIGGIKETLVMDRASFFIDRHAHHTRQFARSGRAFTLLSQIPRLVIDTLAASAMVVIALVALASGQDTQSMLPVLGMFVVVGIRLIPSMSRIVNGLAQLRFHYAATDVLYHELRATQGDGSGRTRPAPDDGQPPQPLHFERSLVLEHLSYCYPAMPRPAVDDVSLAIARGHWVAFVGPTGAGKTTLLDLLLGLLIPTSGKILVDGRNVHDDVAAWQRNVGYIPQDVYLMDDTVRRNVAFGLPDHEIDDERVWHALRAAQVDKLVRSLPDGLSTIVGERGNRLSGGERQRLGIARALYRDPEVLVVDEATANLDNETEAAIEQTLAGLRGAKTIIIVAHRLPLVRRCDQVYLFRQGHVQISGAYSDLLATDPAFQRFGGSTP